MQTTTIRPAETTEDYELAKPLIIEYAESLGVEFCLLGFEGELASLPQMYGPPGGLLLLAFDGDGLVGCNAFRSLGDGVCEMKRNYVVPAARGRSLGRRLSEELIARARSAGYRRMVLDTLPHFTAAVALYRSLGFVDAPRYNENPIEGVTFMELDLQR